MKDVLGRPGTRSSLALRVSQFVCAMASMVTIGSSYTFSSYSAFFYLSFSMAIQFVWSLLLICLDIILLATNTDFHETWAIDSILVGDWCASILSWSAAAASAGVSILFRRDTEFCKAFPLLTCGQYELAVVLAFMAWSFMAASALSLFRFRASL